MQVISAGNIEETMRIVMKYAKEGSTQPTANIWFDSYEQLWQLLRKEFKYKKDPKGKEVIRTPKESFTVGFADCEDFAIIISATLQFNKIPHAFRLYDFGNGGWEHIAIVTKDNVIIDPVNDVFNQEPIHIKKKDYQVGIMNSLSGIPQIDGKNQVKINKEIELLLDSKNDFSTEEVNFMYQYYEGNGGQASKGGEGEGLLYEFFTPDFICEKIIELAYAHGFNGGSVLEPSCGTGRIITPLKDYSNIVGFEINPYSARIAELKHNGMKVYNEYFETAFMQPPRHTSRFGKKGELKTWLKEYPFDLVVGNPPYGIYKNSFSSFFPFEKKLAQIEMVFFYWGLQMLKKGGLMIYVSAQNFMRTGNKYQFAKNKLGEIADLIDAYRLPTVFKYSQVPTDILIFRRK